MMSSRSLALVNDLLALPAEQAWVEFKGNNTEPQMIGQQISALSNAARLADKNHAYMLWGVRDEDHAVIGTGFQPSAERTQGQPLEFSLAQRLSPDVASHSTKSRIRMAGSSYWRSRRQRLRQ